MHVNVHLSLERGHLNQLHHKSIIWGPGLPDATGLVLARVDLVTVSEFLGHSSIEMTMRDAHPSSEKKRRAVQRLDRHSLDTKGKSTDQHESAKLLNLHSMRP